MNSDNYVVFKGRKNGLNIILNDTVDFSTLKDLLKKKVLGAAKFFEDSRAAITFSGRVLSETEETELLKIISDNTNMDISFVFSDFENKKKIKHPLEYLLFQKNETKYYKGAIRSGQSIHYTGSVVVIGDVNPGAQIIAAGNIVILGSLKGLVHAGSEGNFESFIAAVNMVPSQLRIADIFTRFPDDRFKKKEISPSIAYVQDKQIFIEPLVNLNHFS